MDNNVKPQIASISYDEFDAEGERLFKAYEGDRNNLESLNKAADSYAQSTNPDGKKIAELLRGLYYRELGVRETDSKRAVKHLQKAVVFFGKAVGRNSVEAKKVRLELLKKKILSTEKKQKPPKDLFLKRAKLYQELKDLKNYHGDISLYYMFSMLELEPFDDKIIKYAELMVEHAKQSEHQELFYKAKVLLHQVKSSLAPEPKVSLKELEEALNAIRQTSDRYGEEEAQARLAFTKGMVTTDKSKRRLLLAEATQRWDKLGNKKQAVSAAKMLLPVPINVSVILNLTNKALENHQLLNKKIHELITITPGPYALFHHHSHLIERIKDVKKIIKRLGENRKAITDLSIRENALKPVKVIPGKLYSKKLQAIMSKHHDLTEQMKLDMESLYVFGNLLLDQWAYMIGYLVGVNNPDSFNFHALYDEMSSNKDKRLLSLLWDRHRKDIYWLYYQLRSYRNIFIEHVRRPWQRGNTMSVYGDDFNLFIPTPPGWLDDKQIQNDIKAIYHLMPKALKDMSDDYWEKKNLRRVLEVTFNRIDEIEQKDDREKVWNVWKVVGGSTPSYDIVGYRLMNFANGSIATMIEIISTSPKQINLGKSTNSS